MINIDTMVRKEIENGYGDANAQAKVCQDIDLDFIRYSLSDEAVDLFVKRINCLEGLTITRVGRIKELKQQDYHGKRIYIRITDSTGFSIENKLDLGVHNRLDIDQEEYSFDIAYDDEGATPTLFGRSDYSAHFQ